jgi:hypothetical protein
VSDAMRIITAIMCDDIRVEHNGKYILIGVYPLNYIAIRDLEIPIRAFCYVEVDTTLSGTHHGKCRIIDEHGTTLYTDIISLKLRNGPNSFYFSEMNFRAPAAGDLRLQWQFEDSNWSDVTIIKLSTAVPPTTPVA